MPRTKQSTPEEKRKNEAIRRKRLDTKRSESGLKMVKLFFDGKTMEALQKLAKTYGYKPEDSERESRAQVLSNIAGYCIRKEARPEKLNLPDATIKPAVTQQLYALRRVIEFRRNEPKETDASIIKHLNTNRYPTAAQIIKCPEKLGKVWSADDYPIRNWNANQLALIEDKDALDALLEAEKSSRQTTSKRTPLKPKS